MDFPSYSELRISLCSFSFVALLVTILVIIIIVSTSIQTGAFQQIAGPVGEVHTPPVISGIPSPLVSGQVPAGGGVVVGAVIVTPL